MGHVPARAGIRFDVKFLKLRKHLFRESVNFNVNWQVLNARVNVVPNRLHA